VGLNFAQEAREADFRYGLVRVRENAESVAFYKGEQDEKGLLEKVGARGGGSVLVELGPEKSVWESAESIALYKGEQGEEGLLDMQPLPTVVEIYLKLLIASRGRGPHHLLHNIGPLTPLPPPHTTHTHIQPTPCSG